ncbi:MAG: hypothetical protein ACTSPI_13675, partial [Candidatus Heimdallarchaeaceae archaeon]
KTTHKLTLIDLCDGCSTQGGGIKVRRSNGRQIVNWKKAQEALGIKDEELAEFTSYAKESWTITINPE